MLCPLLLLLFLSPFHGSVSGSGSGSGSGSCCATKTVGDFEYSLVPDSRVDKDMEEELDCLDDCVYEREGQQYCFKPGDQQATCGGSGLEEKIRKLEKMIESIKETQKKESSELIKLKSKLQKVPYMHYCGFATQASESGTLKYNTSQSENFHDLSSLSITDGIFTARTQAFYTVSFSCSVALLDGSPVVLELLKNGESVEGGRALLQTRFPAGAGGSTHQHVSSTVVVYMAEKDTLRLQAESLSPKKPLQLSNISLCLTLSRPHARPSYTPQVPQTSRCMKAGLPLRGRCIDITPGSHQLYECQKYKYKIDCSDQSLCDGNGSGGGAACAIYKYNCTQPAVLCNARGGGLPPLPFRLAAVFPGPTGSFSYLPPHREIPYGHTASPNSSLPCTCIIFT